jgi:hypothetical protein
MTDEVNAEFEGYRGNLETEEQRRSFDEKINELLELHGVDYVRGYVDGLRDAAKSLKTTNGVARSWRRK